MNNTVTIGKWGNAQGLRLPKLFCDALGIGVGDKVTVSLEDNKIVIENLLEQHTISSRMKNDWDGKPLKAYEVDWGEPVGKEIW
ncbi:MAG: AbrB/MazE/SpoVT family DNA-binding domain-containing protein [Coriobacteriia bacterium]|nr:AbrB/MazE/SpoVT family DNA-binding domain-containing protein [Coriobacteriia bacterium]